MIGMFEPAPQNPMRKDTFNNLAKTYLKVFTRIYEDLGVDVNTITKVAELGCGKGAIVLAALKVYPNAYIQAVDFHDLLEPSIKHNSRVTFHQNAIINILETNELDHLDALILRGTRDHHGLNKENIQLLKSPLKSDGLLITDADNGDIEEQEWFKKQFQQIWGRDEVWALRVWKAIK